MFRLRYHYSIVSLIAVIIAAVTLSSYYRHTTIEQLIELEERNYLILTQTLSNTLLPRYRDFLLEAETLPRPQLVRHALSKQLHGDVEKIVQHLPVLKIKIFDTNGKILFSTDPDQTGIVKPADYPGSVVARTGEVISEISKRDIFRKIDGSDAHDRSVLSSYLPVYGGPDNKVTGVFEIYSDITATLIEIKRKQLQVSGLVLLIFGLLYAVLYIFVTHAERILTRKHIQATELSSRLGRLLDKSSNEIYVFDADSLRFTHVNQGGRDNLGYGVKELCEMTALDLKPEISRDEFLSYIEPLRKGECDQVNFKTVHRRKDGSTYPVEVLLQYSPAEEPPVYVAMILDVTEKAKADDRLNYLAYYDDLTGLPNRYLFADRLQQALKEADRHEQLVAVLFIDLDQFKDINDSLGHDAGDSLLQEAAERLRDCTRASDTVARWGGDEFSVVLQDIQTIDNINIVADKIVQSFSSPFHIKNKTLFITASIGIILYPLDDNNVESLLKNADTAMYHAKENGRNNYQYYNHEMTVRLEQRLKLENELRQALAGNEFVLFYQPQIDIKKDTVVGLEALIRWQHPQQGLIAPDRFISAAEETGLIVPIGEWVLREACKQNQALQAFGLPPTKVSVNLSPRQLREPNLVQHVEQALQEAGLEPALLDLEITESMLMIDVERVTRALKELSAIGVTISVDDFGTGYSSLAYLKQFPITTLKIDRSFIRDIPESKDDMSITIAIINMAKGLGIKTVAEGVEIEAQLEFLKQHKCNLMQGYYFSKPIAFDEIVTLLQTEQADQELSTIKAAI
ncbi:MAG: GGDEF domain-containing protein [Gammaproteobacteria bacterium]|nr:MAG: GGDEF domain-containing protein [Gammaproteobacteria bacterium]